jgi:hypothetical protein
MGDDRKMNKEQEFRKQTEEAKFEAFSFMCKKVADLEKENAQMKEANETLATMNNNMWVELEKKRAESQGITNKLHQLIKAKEIISKLLSRLNRLTYTGLNCEECKEAEQFLNSEVEK